MPATTTPTICPHCGERPPRSVHPIGVKFDRHLQHPLKFYCAPCGYAYALINNSGHDQHVSIDSASLEICIQALAMERERGPHARKSVIAHLHRRIRRLERTVAALELEGSGWRLTKAGLPDCDTTVLVACPLSAEPVWLGYHDGECWREVSGEPITVTHWQNLPDPPKS